MRAISGLSASGATTRSPPDMRPLSVAKSNSLVLRLTTASGSMRKRVAKLKVMCARSMHQVVGALADAFTRETGYAVDLHFATVGAIQKRLDAGETADVLIVGAPAIDRLAKAGLVDPGTTIATTSIGVAGRAGAAAPDISTPDAFRQALSAAHRV